MKTKNEEILCPACAKVAYATKRQAGSAARAIKMRSRREMAVYQCEIIDSDEKPWHLSGHTATRRRSRS